MPRAFAAVLLFLALMMGLSGPAAAQTTSEAGLAQYLAGLPDIPRLGFSVVREYSHDPAAFTQGLVYDSAAVPGQEPGSGAPGTDVMYESTGLKGHSSLRKVAPDTGAVLEIVPLSQAYFAEGLALHGSTLIQLTLDTKTGFIYDKTSLGLKGTFSHDFAGWGLASDGKCLIASDGSSTLRLLDPSSFAEIGRVAVRAGKRPVTMLNELEYIKGEIWANVWQTPVIVIINPRTGHVTGWLDLTPLVRLHKDTPDSVANGIAYDAGRDRIFVTGKLWPKLYEIKVEAPVSMLRRPGTN